MQVPSPKGSTSLNDRSTLGWMRLLASLPLQTASPVDAKALNKPRLVERVTEQPESRTGVSQA